MKDISINNNNKLAILHLFFDNIECKKLLNYMFFNPLECTTACLFS